MMIMTPVLVLLLVVQLMKLLQVLQMPQRRRGDVRGGGCAAGRGVDDAAVVNALLTSSCHSLLSASSSPSLDPQLIALRAEVTAAEGN